MGPCSFIPEFSHATIIKQRTVTVVRPEVYIYNLSLTVSYKLNA